MTEENSNQQAFEYVSNAEMKQKWALQDDISPNDLSLDKINPGHNEWFKRNQELEIFDRLRKEDPVHYTEDSQFGSYWSITSYEDIKSIDMDH